MLDAGRSRSPTGARGAALLVASCWALTTGVASAQGAEPAPAPVPAPTPTPTPTPAGRQETEGQRLAPVQITGGRANDVEERRNSTTAKIIVGREEIDRFGDSTLGDVLKRLPGVTIQGRPGRGGAIRLRG